MSDTRFPPVSFANDVEPWGHPQTLYGGARELQKAKVLNAPGQGPAPAVSLADAAPTVDVLRFANVTSGAFDCVNNQSVKILDAPTGRRTSLAFRNAVGAGNIYVEFGKDASTMSVIKLLPGQLLYLDSVIPQDDIYVLADAVGCTLAYSYSNTR